MKRTALFISVVGVIAMAGIILYAFTAGDFNQEGSQLLAMPWGVVSLVDLYTGFTLFSLWIYYREKSIMRKILWIVLMMTTGFFAGALYVVLALIQSGNDPVRFFLGDRAPVLKKD